MTRHTGQDQIDTQVRRVSALSSIHDMLGVHNNWCGESVFCAGQQYVQATRKLRQMRESLAVLRKYANP